MNGLLALALWNLKYIPRRNIPFFNIIEIYVCDNEGQFQIVCLLYNCEASLPFRFFPRLFWGTLFWGISGFITLPSALQYFTDNWRTYVANQTVVTLGTRGFFLTCDEERAPWFTGLDGPWPCLQSVNQTGGRKTVLKLIQK